MNPLLFVSLSHFNSIRIDLTQHPFTARLFQILGSHLNKTIQGIP